MFGFPNVRETANGFDIQNNSPFAFLSNMYPAPIWFMDQFFPSSEHLYQWLKLSPDVKEGRCGWWGTKVRTATHGKVAKRLLQNEKCPKIELTDKLKETYMDTALRFKFMQIPALAHLLMNTYGITLVEYNYWGDKYWGVDLKTGEGQNRLGKLLMELRRELWEYHRQGELEKGFCSLIDFGELESTAYLEKP